MTGRGRFMVALGATALGVSIFFVNLSAQGGRTPITICHKSIELKANLTLTVEPATAAKHLAHGDTVGACAASSSR